MRAIRFIVAILPLLLLVTACQKSAPAVGGVPRDKEFNRIVSMSPAITDFLIVRLESAKPIVGITDADDQGGVMDRPKVVKNTKIDEEALVEAKPDLIVYDSMLFGPSEIEKIKSTGAETFDFNTKSYAEHKEMIVRLAAMIKNEVGISEYLDTIDATFARVNNTFAQKKRPRAVLLLAGSGEYMAAGKNGLPGDLIRQSGTELFGPDGDRYETVNVEQLIAWDPQIVFVVGDGADRVIKDPRLASVAAVKDSQVFALQEKPFVRLAQLDLVMQNITLKTIAWADRQP
ncbi:MAG: ABC transporter substrate-binding protein [Fimbriimonadaceae bacterium]|nr:ABC transporter substrate-binding protein [Fimbriimonadaceae bacterium]